jgi:RHS repeat-associated protein
VVADERGNVVQEIRYDSFGRVVESVGALTDAGITLPIGFAGGLYDPDLGQCGYVRFGLRDYDPFPGRFTAKDPLGYAAGDSDLYGYCLDDPVNAVDPTGLKTKVHLYEGVPVDHISVEVGNGPAIGKYPNDNSDIFGGQGKFKTEDRIPDHTIEIETTKEQEEYMKGYQSKAQKALQYITTCLTTIV